jgi:uncharacterized membrane protein YjgN (DUF898 family)
MTTTYAADAFDSAAIGHATPSSGHPERIAFIGSGSEYFRIWIVNLLLTIVTLGIYSAWAKVRRMRYFYDNTRLAGSSFEYHGDPIAILKGRIVAVLLFGGYNVALRYSPVAGLVMLAVLVSLFPWLLWKSLQFKLGNSSYRGIRFGFRGTAGRAYFVYLVLPFLALLSLYMAMPFAHQRMKKFQHEESRYGATHFSFDASVGSFYIVYLIGLGVMLAGLVGLGLAFSGTLIAIIAGAKGAAVATTMMILIFAVYAWMFMLIPVMMTLMQNLVWNHTKLGEHRFTSEMKWTRVAFIAITNVIGVVLTLGLFMPFAHVRMLKYRLESMSLVPHGNLDDFVAAAKTESTAAGEGMADIIGFDLSL